MCLRGTNVESGSQSPTLPSRLSLSPPRRTPTMVSSINSQSSFSISTTLGDSDIHRRDDVSIANAIRLSAVLVSCGWSANRLGSYHQNRRLMDQHALEDWPTATNPIHKDGGGMNVGSMLKAFFEGTSLVNTVLVFSNSHPIDKSDLLLSE